MMNNVEIIKGIDLTIEGLTTIKNSLLANTVENTNNEEITTPPAVREAVSEVKSTVGSFSVEQLKSMKYNEFKKLASSLGVKCTGTREEIMNRILDLDVVIEKEGADVEVSEPVEEDKTPTKSDKLTRSKKMDAKEADEPAKDEFDEQAEEIAKDTPVEDILEVLADIEIKATKKNVVEKLAFALREGLIELDDEDEEEDEDVTEESDDTSEDNGAEITATSYFAELDPNGYNNPEEMTEERAEAIEDRMDKILTAYSEGELSDEEIASYVEDNATEEEIELLGDEYDDEDILKLYMELVKRTIDNDGEEHEQGEPYEVADKDVCCGHELKYVKKTKKYICEHCGTEYEAE